MRRLGAFVAAASLAGATLLAMAGPAAAATTIVVHPGQSIQAAVNTAHAGDTVLVEAGVYHQSVAVLTDGLKLIGHGAVLEPPAEPSTSPCFDPSSGLVDGICMSGRFDDNGNLLDPLSNVWVRGFTVRHFTSSGIILFGGENVHVIWNTAAGNDEYGIARFVSTGGSVEHNDVSGAQEAGIYWGDSPHSNAIIAHNHAHGNGNFGFFFRDSSHGEAFGNLSNDNCLGMIVLRTGEVTVEDWNLHDNVVRHNDAACPATEEGPPISGVGIAVAGASHVTVWQNRVNDNVATGPSFVSGGIAVFSTAPLGGVDEHDVTVTHNTAFGNQPADLLWDGMGSGVAFSANSCGSSIPPGSC